MIEVIEKLRWKDEVLVKIPYSRIIGDIVLEKLIYIRTVYQ